MARQLVSAALIVRNEESFLRGCLASLRGVVDEVVVVDTGSSDATRQIALENGARVFDFPWCDDFSAARNYAIDCATGDWILYIDADERIHTSAGEGLARELEDARMVACTVRFYPRSGYTAYPEHRLFRRDARIRFAGAIHETIVPGVVRIVTAGQGYIGVSKAQIEHLGYDGNQRHKLGRNLQLLLKQLKADPGRLYLWWHLGTVYRDLDRLNDAEAAWREGIRLSQSSRERIPEDGLCFIEMAKLLMGRGDDPLFIIDEGLGGQPDNYLLHWLKGKALIAGKQPAAAIPIFEALATIDAETLVADVAYDKRMFGAWAFAELGECAFRTGRYRESERWYGRAAGKAPQSLEFRIKRELARSRIVAPNVHPATTQACHV